MPSTDLHGMTKARAEAAVERFLMMVRGQSPVEIITGKGHGNKAMEPAVGKHIHKWLKANGDRLGVQQVEDKMRRAGVLLVYMRKRS